MGFNVSPLVKNQPLNAGFISKAVCLQDIVLYSVSFSFTGSPCSFTAQLVASSDPENNTPGYAPGNTDVIVDSPVTFTTAGNFTYNVFLVGYNWVQLQIIDNSSGSNTGVLNATLNAKGPV